MLRLQKSSFVPQSLLVAQGPGLRVLVAQGPPSMGPGISSASGSNIQQLIHAGPARPAGHLLGKKGPHWISTALHYTTLSFTTPSCIPLPCTPPPCTTPQRPVPHCPATHRPALEFSGRTKIGLELLAIVWTTLSVVSGRRVASAGVFTACIGLCAMARVYFALECYLESFTG
jgi:hypothetical protein